MQLMLRHQQRHPHLQCLKYHFQTKYPQKEGTEYEACYTYNLNHGNAILLVWMQQRKLRRRNPKSNLGENLHT